MLGAGYESQLPESTHDKAFKGTFYPLGGLSILIIGKSITLEGG
jgi:hypothetical protein